MLPCLGHSTALVIALRSVLATVLLAVLAVGGVALPTVHHAAHGLEVAEARVAHDAAHHADAAHSESGQTVEAPCPPAPNDVDCAVCVGLSVAADVASAQAPPSECAAGALLARADWVRANAATSAGARAPPIG